MPNFSQTLCFIGVISVIQSYKSEYIFSKSEYSAENRNAFWNRSESIRSKSGFVEGNTLYLPELLDHTKILNQTDLIILQDTEGFDREAILKEVKLEFSKIKLPDWFVKGRLSRILDVNKNFFAFSKLERRWYFEIFELAMKSNDSIEFFLNYSGKKFTIGDPKRSDHKFAELTKSHPIRYKLNGKSDATMSAGSERSYLEIDYIFEFAGIVEKVDFVSEKEVAKIKQVPISNCQEVNERKILY